MDPFLGLQLNKPFADSEGGGGHKAEEEAEAWGVTIGRAEECAGFVTFPQHFFLHDHHPFHLGFESALLPPLGIRNCCRTDERAANEANDAELMRRALEESAELHLLEEHHRRQQEERRRQLQQEPREQEHGQWASAELRLLQDHQQRQQQQRERQAQRDTAARARDPPGEFHTALSRHMASGKLVKSVGRLLSRASYGTLDAGRDISSDAIDCFLAVLSRVAGGAQPLNSFFSEYLATWHEPALRHPHLQQDEAGLLRAMDHAGQRLRGYYANKMDWSGEKHPIHLIPIFLPGHWALAIFDTRSASCEFWDSFHFVRGSAHNRVTGFEWWQVAFQNFVREFAPASYTQHVTFTFANENSLHQTHANDCGAFLCFYGLLRVFAGMPAAEVAQHPDLTPAGMQQFRKVLKHWLRPFVEDQ